MSSPQGISPSTAGTDLVRSLLAAGPPLLLLTTLVAVLAPKGTAWLMPLQGIAACLAYVFARGRAAVPALPARPLALSGAMLVAVVLLSAVNSADTRASLAAAALLAAYLCAAGASVLNIAREHTSAIEQYMRMVAIAVFAGAMFLAIELLTGSAIQRFLFTHIPLIRPDSPAHVGMQDGRVTVWAADEMNAGIAVANMLLWPAILGATALWHRPNLYFGIALFALVLAVTFLSNHETSKVAIVAGATVFALFALSPQAARKLVLCTWVLGIALIVPAAHLAYDARLHQAEWMPVNARARLIIWDATASRVPDAPLLGVGAAATKTMTQAENAQIRPDHVIPWDVGAHAHNIYLQIWYEVGLLGAVMLMALGCAMIWWISMLPLSAQRYALSTFTVAAAIGASSWGLWQPWFMATYCFVATVTVLAVRSTRTLPSGSNCSARSQPVSDLEPQHPHPESICDRLRPLPARERL